jgi:gluconate 2-dehydrogenase alpha chain
MVQRLPPKDAVIIGLGWTGSILSNELVDAGLDVVAIERGPWRDTAMSFPVSYIQDELRYRLQHDLFLRPAQASLTFRNNKDHRALPVRTWGAFMLGNGAGGAGIHWNAETFRFLPSDFVLHTHLTQRYGARFLPEDMTIQDWDVTFDQLEPHYDRFEYLCGTSGTAGNIKGEIREGGNPFEGARSRPYPTPAQKQPFSHTLFAKASREMGYKPYPQPSGNLSEAYTNPLGVQLGPCTYCGFCEWFGCANYSKASPQTTILPALVRKPGFEARTGCEVLRINLDPAGKRATGVTYVDTSGDEWEQPADLVILCAFQLFNVHLLLHSGIGKPYDPQTGEGQIGRNFSHQTVSTAIGFFDKDKYIFNPFIASGSIGMCIDEFNGDNFDHGPHGFVGGGYLGQVQTSGRPIENTLTPPGTPRWGPKWKQAVKDNYLSTVNSGAGVHASCYSYRSNHIDLDPTYKDRFGRPLIRLTMDFHENELKMSEYLTDRYAEIIERMGARQVVKQPRKGAV